ncbi:MAG: hypothetical protein ACI9P5_002908 [Saprospiraceae bacterium]|jgi:hypothetical protein
MAWTAPKGDNAYSLSKNANIRPGYTNFLVENQHGNNYRGGDNFLLILRAKFL